MTDNAGPNSIVDTTDCFEAISTFKSTKNFLFLIILLTLLTLQTIFWMNRLGYVNQEYCQNAACASQACLFSPQQCQNCDLDADPSMPPPPEEAADQSDNIDSSKVVEQAQQKIEQNDPQSDSEAVTDHPQVVDAESEGSKIDFLSKLKPNICCASLIIKICNYLLIFASVIYSLILLMSIKLSITGRMGGITHVSKAFIFSLYALVFLLPWQQIFPQMLAGAIYTPAELFNGWQITADTTLPMTILFYLRFTGLWLIVFLLFFCAQLRSAKWAKTILRRLGMLS